MSILIVSVIAIVFFFIMTGLSIIWYQLLNYLSRAISTYIADHYRPSGLPLEASLFHLTNLSGERFPSLVVISLPLLLVILTCIIALEKNVSHVDILNSISISSYCQI